MFFSSSWEILTLLSVKPPFYANKYLQTPSPATSSFFPCITSITPTLQNDRAFYLLTTLRPGQKLSSRVSVFFFLYRCASIIFPFLPLFSVPLGNFSLFPVFFLETLSILPHLHHLSYMNLYAIRIVYPLSVLIYLPIINWSCALLRWVFYIEWNSSILVFLLPFLLYRPLLSLVHI